MEKKYHIAIIGAGASGLAAAAVIAQSAPELKTLILEKCSRPGVKLSATGNGRCNLTNRNCRTYPATAGFMGSLGVYMREEDMGRMYPHSEDANAVLNALTGAVKAEIVTGCRVLSVKRQDEDFGILAETGQDKLTVLADRVLIATGGKSYPACGTTGDGYIFARELGHRVSPLIPGLTPVEVEEDISGLKGVRAKGICTLLRDSVPVAREEGEVQFREKSLSGICVMNLSLLIRKDHTYEIALDAVPELTEDRLTEFNADSLVRSPLAAYALRKGMSLKDIRFRVRGLCGWKEAQITAGGVELGQVDPDTMESLCVPGLYFSGEVLDYQGPCGGYNLNNAWITGISAGKAMAGSFMGVKNR